MTAKIEHIILNATIFLATFINKMLTRKEVIGNRESLHSPLSTLHFPLIKLLICIIVKKM